MAIPDTGPPQTPTVEDERARWLRAREDAHHLAARLEGWRAMGDIVGGKWQTTHVTGPWRRSYAVDTRPVRLDWRPDLPHAVSGLRHCSRRGTVGILATPTGALWHARPNRCGWRLCPICLRGKAGGRVRKVAPVALRAPKGGAMLTITRRAIGGEGLGSALDDLLTTWGDLRTTRALRGTWDRAAGWARGVEAPRSGGSGKRGHWHVHAHVAILGAEAVDVAHELRRAWLDRRPDALPVAQDVRPMGGDARDLMEVLKYPVKPTQLRGRWAAEAAVALLGRRPHQVGGALHGSSRAQRDARARWLDSEDPLAEDDWLAHGLAERSDVAVWVPAYLDADGTAPLDVRDARPGTPVYLDGARETIGEFAAASLAEQAARRALTV